MTAPVLLVVMTLTTRAGTPASIMQLGDRQGGQRRSVAGFSTAVQPAASAGAILRVAMAAGKFQGVISTQTPIGCSGP